MDSLSLHLAYQRLSSNPLVPVLEFKAGETIFTEGERGELLFIITSGQVKIKLKTRVLAVLQEQDVFGEMALIDNSPRSATAIAKTDVTVVPISKRDFLALVKHSPEFALTMMRLLTKRLRVTNQAL